MDISQDALKAQRGIEATKREDLEELLVKCHYYASNLRRKLDDGLDLLDHEDVVQTSFSKIWSGKRYWNPDEKPLLLILCGVIKSIYLNDLKAKKRERIRSSVADGSVVHAHGYFSPVYYYEEEEFYSAALNFLKNNHPELARIFELATQAIKEGRGKRNKDIADFIGISESKYSKSRKEIQETIRKWSGHPEIHVEPKTGGSNDQQKTARGAS